MRNRDAVAAICIAALDAVRLRWPDFDSTCYLECLRIVVRELVGTLNSSQKRFVGVLIAS